ncbi:MAG: hypothetical protein IJ514_01285 [Clostridia bacterium]|nr:hypothetical protein [Clostridia bacterium]
MSNINTNSFAYGADTVPETLPETSGAPKTEAKPPKKKNVASRIFALLLAAVSVAIVFLLKVNVIVGNAAQELTLFAAIKDLFGGAAAYKLFGLPTLASTARFAGIGAAIALYLLVLSIALSVIFALIALFSGKKAPALLRLVAFFFTLGFAAYAIVIYMYTSVAADKGVIDLYSIAPAAVGALIYFVLGVAKIGKKAWINAIQLLLSIAAMGALAYMLIKYGTDFNKGVSPLVSFRIAVIAIVAVAFLSVLIGAIRLQTKKGLGIDLVRYILQLLIGGAACYVAIASKATDKTFLILTIAAAAVSLVQIVICVIQKKGCCKKAKKAAKAEKVEEEEAAAPVEEAFAPVYEMPAPAPAPMPMPAPMPTAVAAPVVEAPVEEFPDYVVEEYAEAMPYEGGPVEGVAVAEEVNPTFVAPPAQVQTAGYDFYNSKSFDPFIASLNEAERNQFTELFILKYKGTMPEIPDYEVGGDNKSFFRKLFIYLGQYRDRIPDGLLAKIYQFTVRM